MNSFEQWCAKAVEKIRFAPDRKAVYDELFAHLEDRYDAFLAEGLSREEAEKRALDAMGSAEIIAPQLGQIHRPWLGYLYRIAKPLAVLACLWAVFLLTAFSVSHVHTLVSTANYQSLREAGQGGFYSEPNVSGVCDGYRFRVTEAAVSGDGGTLYLELQTTYWPWMQQPTVLDHFWAVDSLGNYYASRAEAHYDDIPKVTPGGGMSTSGFSSRRLEVVHFDGSAQWVELHYDRDGRDLVLRVDLTGGDGE